uniref:PDCT1 n=1 Tax=Arundo donax TaxID=35708 RepID=A0A0A9FIH0_ARUDO
MRSPRPVLTNPRAKKKDMTMSQMTSLVKAEKAAVNGSVCVATAAVSPRKAQAPTGSGPSTSPAMVERKMERSCHARRLTSAGRGARNRTARPTAREMTSGTSFAPAAAGGAGPGSGLEIGVWEERRGGRRWRRGVWDRW